MRLVTRTIEHDSRADVWYIRPLGDIHLGSVNCDEAQLDRDIRWILEKDAWWIGMGDYLECITRKDLRFRPEDVAEWCRGEGDVAEAQLQRFVSKIGPIKDKCIGLVKGNHEDKIYDKWDNDIYGRLLYYLKVPEQRIRLDTRGFIRLRFRRRSGAGAKKFSTVTVPIFVEHGYGGGRLEGAPALALARLSKNYDARIYMEGHRHREISFPDERVRICGSKLISEKILFVCSGTYLLSWKEDTEIYVERKQFPPKPTGSPFITLVPWAERDDITVTI